MARRRCCFFSSLSGSCCPSTLTRPRHRGLTLYTSWNVGRRCAVCCSGRGASGPERRGCARVSRVWNQPRCGGHSIHLGVVVAGGTVPRVLDGSAQIFSRVPACMAGGVAALPAPALSGGARKLVGFPPVSCGKGKPFVRGEGFQSERDGVTRL